MEGKKGLGSPAVAAKLGSKAVISTKQIFKIAPSKKFIVENRPSSSSSSSFTNKTFNGPPQRIQFGQFDFSEFSIMIHFSFSKIRVNGANDDLFVANRFVNIAQMASVIGVLLANF